MNTVICTFTAFVTLVKLRWSNCENDFIQIVNKDYFIDKTMLIQDFFVSREKAQAIMAPPRFGKTINLRMLEWFLQSPTSWNGSLANRETSVAYRTFKRLKIGRASNFDFDKYFGLYNVIYLDFRNLNGFADYKSFIGRLRTRIRLLFLNFDYLLDSKILNNTDKKSIDECTHVHRCNETIDEETLKFCGAKLTYLLKKHTNQSCVILIDALDAPIHDAFIRLDNKFWLFHEEFIKVSKFLGELVASLVDNNPNVYKSYSTGTIRLGEPYTQFAKTLVYKSVFHGKDPILKHYGFTHNDVKDLVRTYKKTEAEHQKLELFFRGYRCRYLEGSKVSHLPFLYNPQNVVRFFWDNPTWLRSLFDLQQYRTTPDLMMYENLLNSEVTIDDIVKCLAKEGVVVTNPSKTIPLEALIKFKIALLDNEINPSSDFGQNLTARDIFLQYLFENGMLTYKNSEGMADPSISTLVVATWVVHDQIQQTLKKDYFQKRAGNTDKEISNFLEKVTRLTVKNTTISSFVGATAKLFRNTEYPKTKHEMIASIFTFIKTGYSPDLSAVGFIPDGQEGILIDLIIRRYQSSPILVMVTLGTEEKLQHSDGGSQSEDAVKRILDVNAKSPASSFEATTVADNCGKECLLVGLHLNKTHLGCSVLLYINETRAQGRELLTRAVTENAIRENYL